MPICYCPTSCEPVTTNQSRETSQAAPFKHTTITKGGYSGWGICSECWCAAHALPARSEKAAVFALHAVSTGNAEAVHAATATP